MLAYCGLIAAVYAFPQKRIFIHTSNDHTQIKIIRLTIVVGLGLTIFLGFVTICGNKIESNRGAFAVLANYFWNQRNIVFFVRAWPIPQDRAPFKFSMPTL